MFGAEGFNGPRFVFDSPSSTIEWSYEIARASNVPNAPCKAVAVERFAAESIHTYILGCVMQEAGRAVELHFAEMNLINFTSAPDSSDLSIGEDQYLNAKLNVLFSNGAVPPAYQVKSLEINSFGSLLLELKDDEVSRLYMSLRLRDGDMFENNNSYTNFAQLYARLGSDTAPPILTTTSIIFSDELITQEPEIVELSIFEGTIKRLSVDDTPQYSPIATKSQLFWFDERYQDSTGDSIGTAITAYRRME